MQKTPLILIVDDAPKNLQVLGNILNQENYQIAAAINGRQALTMTETVLPDLILLDIMMPDLDGFEVCEKLKQSENTKDIPIIFLTAKTATQDIVKGFHLGAVDYVTKPFNSTELLARVQTHLELKSARDRLEEKTEALTGANTRLQHANCELRERQNLIVRLLGDMSKIRFSGERHAIRNFAQKIFENEKNLLVQTIAEHIHLIFELIKENSAASAHLIRICKPFGITSEIITKPRQIENILHKIVIENRSIRNSASADKNRTEEFDELLESIFSADIYFDEAHQNFLKIQNTDNKDFLPARFDPFVLFYTLRDIRSITDEINKRFSDYGKTEFLDSVLFSESLHLARQQAVAEKEHPLKVSEILNYDPIFNTNKDALVFMLRDLFYNAIDAGADQVNVVSHRPSREENLPYYNAYRFDDYPSFYLLIEDNGKGISAQKAKQLNTYLNEAAGDEISLSAKGGLGTKNLRDFLYLHKGRCHYEPFENGTRVHIYFERLEI